MKLYATTKRTRSKATIVIFGDEFLGRSEYNFQSFNVIIRNDRIPYRKQETDFQCSEQPFEGRALIGFGCDAIGRFKSTFASRQELLNVLTADTKDQTTTRLITDMKPWIQLDDVMSNLKAVLSSSGPMAKL